MKPVVELFWILEADKLSLKDLKEVQEIIRVAVVRKTIKRKEKKNQL